MGEGNTHPPPGFRVFLLVTWGEFYLIKNGPSLVNPPAPAQTKRNKIPDIFSQSATQEIQLENVERKLDFFQEYLFVASLTESLFILSISIYGINIWNTAQNNRI